MTTWPGNKEWVKNCTLTESTSTSTPTCSVAKPAFLLASTWGLSTMEGLPVRARLKESNLQWWQVLINLIIKSPTLMEAKQKSTQTIPCCLEEATATTTRTSKDCTRTPWTLFRKLARTLTLPKAKFRHKRTEPNQRSILRADKAVSIPRPRCTTQWSTSRDLGTNSTPKTRRKLWTNPSSDSTRITWTPANRFSSRTDTPAARSWLPMPSITRLSWSTRIMMSFQMRGPGLDLE